MPPGNASLFGARDEPTASSRPSFRAAPAEPQHDATPDLADQLEGAIAVIQDGHLTFVNAGLASYFGYPSAAPLLGMKLETFVLRHVAKAAQRETLAWLETDADVVRIQKHELCSADGAAISAECTASPVRFARQRATACVWYDAGLTKQAQARAARAERLSSLTKLAAGVAHEINNPLAYMAVNLDLALEELRSMRGESPPGDTRADRLADIELALTDVRDGVQRVGRTVDDLNALVLAGRNESSSADVRIALDAALSSLQNRLPEDTRVHRSYAEVPRVRGGEAWLERACYELLHNSLLALETLQSGRELSLTVTRSSPHVVKVCIDDTGPGISNDRIGRVFEPFYTTRPCGAGRGLGLSIAHNIATSLGGSLDLESEPGVRTRATLRLPVSG